MHRFFFATKDAFINSGSNSITGEDYKDKNTGQDEILELKKVFWNRDFHYPTRILVQFDHNEINTFLTSNNIATSSYSASLRLYETKGTSGLSETYAIAAYPLSQSWSEGVGKEGDVPKTTDGVSWKNRQYPAGGSEVNWSATSGNTFASSSMTFVHVPSGSDKGASDEITIGSVDYTFVSSSAGLEDSSTQVFLDFPAATTTNTKTVSAAFRDAINDAERDGVTSLGISASKLDANSGTVEISGSSAGTGANLTVTTGSGGDATATTLNFINPVNIQGGTDTTVAGAGGRYIASGEVTQSFSAESPDINMNITPTLNKWISGEYNNYGLLLRLSGSRETSTGSFEDLKFFSRQTNTIYSPKVEVKWDDHLPATGSNTGSLNTLDLSGKVENYVYPMHFREAYKETEKVKFRFGARNRYIDKSFTTSVQSVSATGSYFAEGSASYSIIDLATNESMVPFSAYTTMSCDTTSPYFMQDLNGFEPNRAYKILVKVKHNDDQKIIYDDGFEFILRV